MKKKKKKVLERTKPLMLARTYFQFLMWAKSYLVDWYDDR